MAAQLLSVNVTNWNGTPSGASPAAYALNKSRIISALSTGSPQTNISYALLRRMSAQAVPVISSDAYAGINTAITGANVYTAGKAVQVTVLEDNGALEVPRLQTVQVDDIIYALPAQNPANTQLFVEDGISTSPKKYVIQGDVAALIVATT